MATQSVPAVGSFPPLVLPDIMSSESATSGRNKRANHQSDSEEDEEDHEEGGYMIGDVYIPPPPPPPSFSGEETGKRILITHITNIDFKSYAGEKVLGPFHKVSACHEAGDEDRL